MQTQYYRKLYRSPSGTRGDKTAIFFEPNDPNEEAQHITYNNLHDRVCKMANVLKRKALKKEIGFVSICL